MIEKTTKDAEQLDWTVIQKEVFVETVTEIKTIEWSIDQLESSIAQKQNTVDNLLVEIDWYKAKLKQIKDLTQ